MGGALGGAHYNENLGAGAAGGAAGGAIGKGVGDLWRYWRSVGLGGPGAHAKEFYDLDPTLRLTPGERSGWEWLIRGELARGTHAISGIPTSGITAPRQNTINRIMAEKIGMPNKNKLTDGVIDAAATKIKEKLDKFAALPYKLNLHADFLKNLQIVEEGMDRSIQSGGETGKKVIGKIIDVMKSQDGVIDMRQYQRFSSELMKEASKAYRGQDVDHITGEAMTMIKDALDDIVEKRLSATNNLDLLGEFSKAKDQWRNLSIVQGSKIVQGNIDPSSMMSAIRKGSAKKRTTGRDFSDPANIFARFGRDYSPAGATMVFNSMGKPMDLAKGYMIGSMQNAILGGRSPYSAAFIGRTAPGLGIGMGSERGPVEEELPEQDRIQQALELAAPYMR